VRELSIWLDAHCPRGDMGVFRSVAELYDASTTDHVEAVSDGEELLALIASQDYDSVDHLVIAGHGGTTWLLDDEHGVTTGEPRHHDQVAVWRLAEVLAPVLSGHSPLISLAACLCSRSPTWLLRRRLGQQIGSDWGARAYQPGGQASLSARLRDYLHYYGVYARVRGHRAAGHASALALLAEHRGGIVDPVGSPCETLYRWCFPEISPTTSMRRWWVRHVTGRLAQRWLMGDDSVVEEIRGLRVSA